ncbi:hypothetical protein Patl1_27154 [Pistacia atlantica]|uniref:Uncharacterized protein n=1 Tax=Pistacia atlantica TaxID=434234 RepID=A0ACC1B1D5_9ROSI|nr:hypothetical protein Patl1_27154 [Pistacia atlantica]
MPATKKTNTEIISHAFEKLMCQIGHPVEFELPDYFIKSRPTPYTFIKRSILFNFPFCASILCFQAV